MLLGARQFEEGEAQFPAQPRPGHHEPVQAPAGRGHRVDDHGRGQHADGEEHVPDHEAAPFTGSVPSFRFGSLPNGCWVSKRGPPVAL